MAEPLKNVYSEAFIDNLSNCISKIIPKLDQKKLKNYILTSNWENLELKERMSRLSNAMATIFPINFYQATPLMYELVEVLQKDTFPSRGYEYMFIPDYVEKFGREEAKLAFLLLARITQFVSSEFAIRPFIIDNEEQAMKQMLKWSKSNDKDIRRLASEGCRSRLPWAMALPRFKKNAALILPILENLKNDDSFYVRKSVANNLNDVSKDHPELALCIAKEWKGVTKETDWVVKHGMRTLLKSGNLKAMELFGYAPITSLKLNNFNVNSKIVEFGESLNFNFILENSTPKALTVRLEYGIYFLKNNGSLAKKVFKISEREMGEKEILFVEKKHKIQEISTRKYYAGMQAVALIVNGIEFDKQPFLLNM